MTGHPDYDVGDLVVAVPNGGARGKSSGTVTGRVYRVVRVWHEYNYWRVWVYGVACFAEGISQHRFRKADPLPDALTSLLASKPVRERIDA